jgi:hypothetical protein
MQITKRVIHLAKERALFAFSMLAQNMISDAGNGIVQSGVALRSSLDQRTLSAARQFLREDSNLFLQRFEAFYRDYVERAMQTMYTDLRTGLSNLSADHLSLIDDETVNRQIEVDRLVVRMRDVDHENLGRLNMMIAQLHGDHDVRERENPFRPYLLARSLHEVLRDMVKDEALVKILFDSLSNAMTNHLPGYYAAIREVFESSGVRTRLLARPSMVTRAQRDMLAQQPARSVAAGPSPYAEPAVRAEAALPQNFDSRIMPGLQHMLELQQKNSPAAQMDNQAHQSVEFQDFVWQIFNQPKPAGLQRNQDLQNTLQRSTADTVRGKNSDSPSAALVSQLKQYQQQAARGQALSEQISPDQNQLFVLREQIGTHKATDLERVTIDVVALLFEFILQDEQIPKEWRGQIGRLQIPVLKAALLAPELLHHASHPARQLLNRMGSLAVGLAPDAPVDHALESEIIRIVSKILEEFDDDLTIFSECLDELHQLLAEHLRNAVPETKPYIDAIEEAEKTSVVLANISITLQSLLGPLNVDARVSNFIMRTWARVLAYPLCMEVTGNAPTVDSGACYREVLSDLVWSVQEKQTSQERRVLMKMLPNLVKRLKNGLEMIRLTEQESKQALDQLVEVHTQVLRTTQVNTVYNLLSLEELQRHFSLLAIDDGTAFWMEDEPVKIPAAVMQAVLDKSGIAADLDVECDAIAPLAADADWLMQMQLGTCVELWSGDTYELARLNWISTHSSLYLFRPYANSLPAIYSARSLIKALRDGAVRPIEYAPLFDRAVESLLAGAESVHANHNFTAHS